ncbi:MAG: bifunctional 4-hydroxy-3-methylbut-2-enyl diphosphate reductase/30S ribosomal protein S1, partial [Oscillospiraceae bacterium]
MKLTVAKSAGFCFGVKRAVDLVFEKAEGDRPVCTLGPIIHNPQIVSQLKDKGVEIVQRVEDCDPGALL